MQKRHHFLKKSAFRLCRYNAAQQIHYWADKEVAYFGIALSIAPCIEQANPTNDLASSLAGRHTTPFDKLEMNDLLN